MSLDEFIKLLTSNFCKSYVENRDQIEHLKSIAFELKKELFQLENNTILSDLSNMDLNETSPSDLLKELNKKIIDQDEDSSLVEKLIANVEFISNIVKLKSLGRDFKLNEKNNAIILECLVELFKQIDFFLFQDKLKRQDLEDSDVMSDSFSSSASKVSFPIESILHAIQLFINIFEIEWFYYLRDNLVGLINTFLGDLVKYLIEYPGYMEQVTRIFVNNSKNIFFCSILFFYCLIFF